jgi:hypothetical protein
MLGPTVLFELTVAGGFDVLVTVNVRMHVHPDSIRLISRGWSARFAEQLVAFGEKLAVWLVVFAARNDQTGALETLQTMDEHWPILLAQDVATDFHNQVRPDSKHLSIECGVVQCAQS